MNETKTARASPDCPTLLHYLARVLLRKDPSLTTFIYELPSLEAATRSMYQIISILLPSHRLGSFHADSYSNGYYFGYGAYSGEK